MGEERCCSPPPPRPAGRGVKSRSWKLLSQLPLPWYQEKSSAGACASLAALSWAGCGITGAEEALNSLSRSQKSLYLGKLRPWGDTSGGELIPLE